MQTMSEAQLSTRDVASRLGISTSDLAELRLKTGELPIEQDGLKLFYSAETVQAFERSEALKDTPRQYLNRLSDLLFVLARVLNRMNGGDDVYWKSERLAQQAPGTAGDTDAG